MEDPTLLQLVVVGLMKATVATIPLFLLVLAITGLGRRWLAPWARQTLWTLVLVRLLLPVSFGSPVSLQPGALALYLDLSELFVGPQSKVHVVKLWKDPSRIHQSTEPIPQGYYAPPSPFPDVDRAPHFDPVAFAVSHVLPCAFVAGMLLVAVWTIITTIRLRRLVRTGTDCQREDWQVLLAEGREAFRIRRTVVLRTIPGLTSPATCGVWRPAILLPEDADQWSSTELRHVVWHELAHIRRFDVAANWLLAAVRMLHWWNPLFWLAQRAWLNEREMACDALVLRKLGSDHVAEYGNTILRFLERFSARGHGVSTSAAPGFVLFLGRKQAVRRRMAQLAAGARPDGRRRSRAAGGLIIALGLAGLTDAAAQNNSPPSPASFELPSGTTWKIMVPNDSEPGEPLVEREYDLTAVIATLRQDMPGLTAIGAAASVQQIFRPLIGLPFEPPQSSLTSNGPKVELAGERLIVNAVESQHAEINKLLTLWETHGQRQVAVQVQWVTAPYSLKELLLGDGGQVWNSGASAQPRQGLLQLGPDVSAADAKPYGILVYTRVLSPQQTQAFESAVLRVSPQGSGNLLFTPKITSFEGVAAIVEDSISRPFVTGLRTLDDGRREPQISFVAEGISLKMQSIIEEDGESVRLGFAWRHAEITDMELLTTRSGTEETIVQVPQVSDTTASIESSIPAEHSLLVAPLRRNRDGQLLMFLVTPRVLTAEDMK